MKIAVSSTGGSLDDQIDPRLGRCSYFLIVDSETMKFEAIPNTASGAMSGAGIQAAQLVANRGVQTVLTGNVGPNAFQALSSAGISIITGVFGTVREAVEKFKSGQLQTDRCSHDSHGIRDGRGLWDGHGQRAWRWTWDGHEALAEYWSVSTSANHPSFSCAASDVEGTGDSDVGESDGEHTGPAGSDTEATEGA